MKGNIVTHLLVLPGTSPHTIELDHQPKLDEELNIEGSGFPDGCYRVTSLGSRFLQYYQPDGQYQEGRRPSIDIQRVGQIKGNRAVLDAQILNAL